jgi:putative transposase
VVLIAAKTATKKKILPTIWEIPDELWERIEPILMKRYPPARTGRPRADLRQVLNTIIFRMRSGVQWNKLPRELANDSTAHRWFQRFVEDGIFAEIWGELVLECDELGDVSWEWQAADAMMGKARMGGEKRAPIPLTERNRARRRACSSKRVAVRLA